jgi:hypothetical protein
MSDSAIIQLIGFATLIAGYAFKLFQDGRNRKWDLQDAKRRDEEKILANAALRREVVRQGLITQDLVQDNTTAGAKQAEANAAHMTALEDKQNVLSGVVEIQALDTLHHAEQPFFDDLIDKYKEAAAATEIADQRARMNDQELTQFIQRLHVIANDTAQRTAQQPNAKFMLGKALDMAIARGLKPAPPSEADANISAGESMRIEAHPQRDLAVDDGEGPKSKPRADWPIGR